MKYQGGIYEITNKVDGHRYIGSSEKICGRFNAHRCLLRANKHHSPHLQNAWNKHGESSFRFSVLLITEKDLLVYFEQKAIDLLRPEYNIATCAEASSRGRRHSEKTKKLMSKTRTGKKLSEETKIKIGIANTGKRRPPVTEECRRIKSIQMIGNKFALGYKHTEETLKIISYKSKNRSQESRDRQKASRAGYRHSDETKRKISMGNTGKKLSEETKQKISTAHIGMKNHLGIKHSEQTKQKIRIKRLEYLKNKAASLVQEGCE